MKKVYIIGVLIFVMFLVNGLSAAEGYPVFKLQFDFPGEAELDGDFSDPDSGSITGETDVEDQISLGFEYFRPYNERWEFGFGVSYHLDRNITEVTELKEHENFDEDVLEGLRDDIIIMMGMSDWNFIPVYGTAKYNFAAENKYKPYLFGHLGYNFFNIDLLNALEDTGYANNGIDEEGGLYYGLGAGVNISANTALELMYSVNNGNVEGEYTVYNNGNPTTEDFDIDIEYSKFTLALAYKF
ncbi:outer membrane beta-barrel protein [Halanaerobium sp. MA284_MarDTE_T2]|uniref:outer membrane beta-barrel protein n=1 Tax=Halanaerobium sp. MA284_MarDTE_T2 TaxID=2183913 RepID=UPI000DF2C67C|nr:outer membrane beta-barrel protein [Halanaerobium sp. MA284_MarDTE_T2]RCW50520.1 outer membrane protein with beta-barrel domain [Halanaerobium sp. MA284_MarDTE_T2]